MTVEPDFLINGPLIERAKWGMTDLRDRRFRLAASTVTAMALRCGGQWKGTLCDKKLAVVLSVIGRIDIVCPRCGHLNVFD